MFRRDFIRRMIFAGLATWFLDLPLPRERGVQRWLDGREVERIAVPDDGRWHLVEILRGDHYRSRWQRADVQVRHYESTYVVRA